MEKHPIYPDLSIAEVLETYPETIPVFNAYHMACVGCTMAEYESISTAAQNYRLPLEKLLRDLQSAVK